LYTSVLRLTPLVTVPTFVFCSDTTVDQFGGVVGNQRGDADAAAAGDAAGTTAEAMPIEMSATAAIERAAGRTRRRVNGVSEL
jgi:hypothetical protein